jgi:hypothetical protein
VTLDEIDAAGVIDGDVEERDFAVDALRVEARWPALMR